MVLEISDNEFDKTIEENNIVIVDFWAPWCGPCQMMAPIFEELSKKHEDWTFVKLNVDENNEKPSQYSVSGIPTFIIFKGGETVKRIVGARPLESIEREIEDVVE
ncbi:MAG: thioredoxin [Candidatus Huberarchaeum crystalense]|uniref:Thioredoxin n=1 Tax=Huberarchaeum crystalense TaxID=2014257 RepID=A0A2G9LJ78_HUBC1|nr:thioredoxin [archaeon]OIP20794.1 MAG: thioredoxin [archaeon CG2_30_31_98]PIN66589.1 MAG: thioredoxin [Candidatus Huberarchaeum crystalense]NCS98140.1 thioredoxin [archaeon]PIV13894.1 MAG: thioredoxin [Candidatus Huberarchaeum crystalense]